MLVTYCITTKTKQQIATIHKVVFSNDFQDKYDKHLQLVDFKKVINKEISISHANKDPVLCVHVRACSFALVCRVLQKMYKSYYCYRLCVVYLTHLIHVNEFRQPFQFRHALNPAAAHTDISRYDRFFFLTNIIVGQKCYTRSHADR